MKKLLLLLALTVAVPLHAIDLPTITKIRFFPAAGHAQDMVGGQFLGSNGPGVPNIWVHGAMLPSLDSFKVLAEIKDAPPEGAWSELSVSTTTPYRWVIYKGPPGSHGRVAEIEFWSDWHGQRQMRGEPFNSYTGPSWRFATDGKTDSVFEGESADNQFAGFDFTDQLTGRIPALSPAPSESQQPISVSLKTETTSAPIRYTLDGTVPTADSPLYSNPIEAGKATTISAATFADGLAPSPPVQGTYIVGEARRLKTLHIGNSLTDVVFMDCAKRFRTAGCLADMTLFGLPGALTTHLWTVSTGTGTPEELSRWAHAWKDGEGATGLDDFTMQPRDWDVAREAANEINFLDLIRGKSPNVQPWIYIEWAGRHRGNPVDLGKVPNSEMKESVPALTWEESMGAMMVYAEDVQRKIAVTDKAGKRPRILPAALAMGVIYHQISTGQFPGVGKDDYFSELFRDDIHLNLAGDYFIDCLWYATFCGESPEDKVLPIRTNLTPEQAKAMQRIAWDVALNYPDCGFYKEGTSPASAPVAAPAAGPITGVTPVTLSSSTPGAWFRYTLDGTAPTRTNGYIYCGTVSVRPGMTLKAIAYKSGMADSSVTEVTYSSSASTQVNP